jgi:hypothetical protein
VGKPECDIPELLRPGAARQISPLWIVPSFIQ